ncbi:MAG: hypothetical protein PHV80_07960, partial [Rugosibacter sp.]|nr:hypothetical protein [Rugosibacter sp.]
MTEQAQPRHKTSLAALAHCSHAGLAQAPAHGGYPGRYLGLVRRLLALEPFFGAGLDHGLDVRDGGQ